MDDIFVIVISEPPGKFFIVHLWFVFPLSPLGGHNVWIRELELPSIPCPRDVLLARFVREQLKKELPQLDGSAALVPGQEGGGDHGLPFHSHTIFLFKF